MHVTRGYWPDQPLTIRHSRFNFETNIATNAVSMIRDDMRHIYVDESIHVRGNFIVIAAVVTDGDVAEEVDSALADCGFAPGIDEFKSSMPMVANADARALRDSIKGLIFEKSKLAIAVCSLTERGSIMAISANLIDQLHKENSAPATIHFDEGIAAEKISIPIDWSLELHCDSRKVGGIQLADCAAHIVATLILSELGLVDKVVLTHGHYPEPEVELAWELWTDIRYALSSGKPIGGYDDKGWCEPMMHPYGIFISDNCTTVVREAVSRRLGEVWVGCIH